MNAKKIMGAVLVALLAAALFVGAGAAANEAAYNGNTVFVGQVIPDLAGTTWTYGENKVTFNAGGYITGPVVEGKYQFNDTISVNILNPTVIIGAVAEENGVKYNVAGSTYYIGTNLTISLQSPATNKTNITDVLITNPDGSKVKFSEIYIKAMKMAGLSAQIPSEPYFLALLKNDVPGFADIANGTGTATFTPGVNANDFNLTKLMFPVSGTYKFQGILGNNAETDGVTFADGFLLTDLVGEDVLTFNVATKKAVTITADVDSILQGKRFSVTIIGKPGADFQLLFDKTEVEIYSAGAASINATDGNFTMPNTGSITVYLKALTDGETTIGVDSDADGVADAEVEVTIIAGEITAEAEKESYYIGNDVELFGTNTVGNDDLYFYIKGTNFPFDKIPDNKVDYEVENGEWTVTIDGSYFTDVNPDAGSYTIYVSILENAGQQAVEDAAHATVVVALKQPFISVTEAPSVVVSGTETVFKGNAEAADKIGVYIFGTNKFLYNETSDKYMKIEVKDSQFTITLKKNFTGSVDAGQYFMVVQHPMYDKELNVWAENTLIKSAETVNGVMNPQGAPTLFDVKDRQKANAAEALCQAIDSENIDDMYVKLSFVVAAPQSIINPIPETIAQGEKLTISGSTNLGKGELVTVEMLSTAFAAVPKATVGSASFISLSTKTDENGNWEVTFDTSGLNVDEYTVTAALTSLQSSSTAKINVVEGAETPDTPDTPDVPDTPDTPDTPTEPTTPGFGALAALAGLGAVAVLLLRRE